jgi:hypothetical protein
LLLLLLLMLLLCDGLRLQLVLSAVTVSEWHKSGE